MSPYRSDTCFAEEMPEATRCWPGVSDTQANPPPNYLLRYHCLLVPRLAEEERHPLALTSTTDGESKHVDSSLFLERMVEDVAGPAASTKYLLLSLHS